MRYYSVCQCSDFIQVMLIYLGEKIQHYLLLGLGLLRQRRLFIRSHRQLKAWAGNIVSVGEF